jgi:hypothetical protein
VDLELSMFLFVRFLIILHLLKLHPHIICAPLHLDKTFSKMKLNTVFLSLIFAKVYMIISSVFLFPKNIFASTLIFRLSLKVKMSNTMADV